jgi:hypothetical protein
MGARRGPSISFAVNALPWLKPTIRTGRCEPPASGNGQREMRAVYS